MITDSQVHLWEADRPDRPWPVEPAGGPPRASKIDVPIGPAALLPDMDLIGVDRAIIVPPVWAGDGNEAALEWAAQYPTRLAVMGRFALWSPTAKQQLEDWLQQPGMLGIRATFAVNRGVDLRDPDAAAWFWEAAQRLGIPIMLRTMGSSAKIGPIAERHPGLTLIVDHLGMKPSPDGEAGVFTNIDALLGLARWENVLVKASALPIYSTEAYPYPKLAPYIRQVYDVFGPRRMMWGSDYSRLGGLKIPSTYQQCLDHLRVSLDFLSAEDKEWILGRTLAEALHWPAESENS